MSELDFSLIQEQKAFYYRPVMETNSLGNPADVILVDSLKARQVVSVCMRVCSSLSGFHPLGTLMS